MYPVRSWLQLSRVFAGDAIFGSGPLSRVQQSPQFLNRSFAHAIMGKPFIEGRGASDAGSEFVIVLGASSTVDTGTESGYFSCVVAPHPDASL